MTLWVDAICINQNNNEEKASQIKLLPHIFRHAMSTLVFLGENSNKDQAIETLMQIRAKVSESSYKFPSQTDDVATEDQAQEGRPITADDESQPKWLRPVPSSWADKPIPPPEALIWEEINDLFRNPWFRRIWVIQETLAATSVRILCGKWVVEWNDLFSAVEIIDNEVCTRSQS